MCVGVSDEGVTVRPCGFYFFSIGFYFFVLFFFRFVEFSVFWQIMSFISLYVTEPPLPVYVSSSDERHFLLMS